MSEVQTKPKSRLSATVLVFTVPLLILGVLGILSGSVGVGVAEIVLLVVIWTIGLIMVWRPRK